MTVVPCGGCCDCTGGSSAGDESKASEGGSTNAPAAAKKPVIRPFAVMRLCHEAIRVLLKRMSEAAAGGDKAACRAAFEEFEALVAIHMKQEDTELFSMLDRVSDGSVTAAGLAHEHEADAKEQEACRDALRDDNTADMGPVIEAFVASHEAHLAHEEAGTCVCGCCVAVFFCFGGMYE